MTTLGCVRNIIERFEEKIVPEPNSGCWLWLSVLDPKGYGRFRVRTEDNMERAHRFSWWLYRGNIPVGLCVLHKCDVRCCVNPDHLFVGTKADNNVDKERKGRGRHVHGGSHVRASLSESDIPIIRNDTRSLPEIAADYGVSAQAIFCVKRRITWKHIP